MTLVSQEEGEQENQEEAEVTGLPELRGANKKDTAVLARNIGAQEKEQPIVQQGTEAEEQIKAQRE